MTDNRTTELKTLSKLKMAGKLRYWRGTIEIPEGELHAICDEIQAEHEQAIAATLGSGTLTAELVEEIVNRNCEWYEGGEIDAQAILDELNAELGSGTCEENEPDGWHKCDECGCVVDLQERVAELERENGELRKRNRELRNEITEDAYSIPHLAKRIKSLEAENADVRHTINKLRARYGVGPTTLTDEQIEAGREVYGNKAEYDMVVVDELRMRDADEL